MSLEKKIFIDGEVGTTGLQIKQRLEALDSVTLLHISASERKDLDARAEMMKQADLAILCLPDDAAREIVAFTKTDAKILDTSTAHRTSAGWTYGMAELSPTQSKKISQAKLVSNPGCYSLCAIALLRPLVEAGVINASDPLHISGLSGYSGGGKPMIADYEKGGMPIVEAYALTQPHKHLPEIEKYALLKQPPSFMPCVGNFRQGMLVSIFIPHKDAQHIQEIYRAAYPAGGDIIISDEVPARLSPETFAGGDDLTLFVAPTQSGCTLLAACDNLGKGAAGNALANIALMLNLKPKQNF